MIYLSSMPRLLSTLFAACLIVSACDSQGPEPKIPVPDLSEDRLPTPQFQSRLSLSERLMAATLDSTGLVSQSKYNTPTAYASLFAGSLWMSGQQGGETRVAASWSNGSTFGPCTGTSQGVFKLDADTTYDATGWPTDAGAPVSPSGDPAVYGDEMLWMTTCPQEGRYHLDRPFTDLRVNIAAFVRDEYPNVVFVRYEIRNESAAPISEAYVGFWADHDLPALGPPSSGLPAPVRTSENLIGVDSGRRLGYAYVDGTIGSQVAAGYEGTARSDSDRGTVAGMAFLETPKGSPFAAHRMMDKAGGVFGESTVDGPEDFGYALRGLDNDGNAMINPVTNAPTTLAYTGDPVAMTGWLDGYDYCGSACEEGIQVGEELRQLISAGPFDLAAGQSESVTVAYLAQFGSSLGDGLGLLGQDVDQLQAQPSLWQFPVES